MAAIGYCIKYLVINLFFSTLLINKFLPVLSFGLESLMSHSKSLGSVSKAWGILHFIGCLGWVNLNLLGCCFYNVKSMSLKFLLGSHLMFFSKYYAMF